MDTQRDLIREMLLACPMADLQEICRRHHILVENFSTAYKRPIADRILRKVRLSILADELEQVEALQDFRPEGDYGVSRETFRTVVERQKVVAQERKSDGSSLWNLFGTLVGFAATFLLIAFVDTLLHPPIEKAPAPAPTRPERLGTTDSHPPLSNATAPASVDASPRTTTTQDRPTLSQPETELGTSEAAASSVSATTGETPVNPPTGETSEAPETPVTAAIPETQWTAVAAVTREAQRVVIVPDELRPPAEAVAPTPKPTKGKETGKGKAKAPALPTRLLPAERCPKALLYDPLLNEKRVAGAERLAEQQRLERQLRMVSDTSHARFRLSQLLFLDGNVLAAFDHLNAALNLDRFWGTTRRQTAEERRIRCLVWLGRREQALPQLLVARRGEGAMAEEARAELLLACGADEGAGKIIDALLDSRPTERRLHLLLARLHLARDDASNAIRELRRLESTMAADALFHETFADAYVALGDDHQARIHRLLASRIRSGS